MARAAASEASSANVRRPRRARRNTPDVVPDPLPITAEVVLPASDLVVTTARSGGPGGQGVNTTDSRVALRFLLSRSTALAPDVAQRLLALRRRWRVDDGDLLVVCDVTRSQHQNLLHARNRLADAVREALAPPPAPRRPTRPTKGSAERRLQEKARRSSLKAHRGRVDD
jgi:ribosome-associated protein